MILIVSRSVSEDLPCSFSCARLVQGAPPPYSDRLKVFAYPLPARNREDTPCTGKAHPSVSFWQLRLCKLFNQKESLNAFWSGILSLQLYLTDAKMHKIFEFHNFLKIIFAKCFLLKTTCPERYFIEAFLRSFFAETFIS